MSSTALPNLPADERALFVSKRTGKRLTARRVEQIVARCLQSAGLSGRGFSPHKLRHTAATELLRSGASLPEIGQLLRHRRAATTAIYAKVDRDSLRLIARPWPEGDQ